MLSAHAAAPVTARRRCGEEDNTFDALNFLNFQITAASATRTAAGLTRADGTRPQTRIGIRT